MLFLNQVIGFFQIIDDDDIDNIIVEMFHRRNNFFNKYLERERLEFETIELNREVYFTTYFGTWFERYSELQFRRDFRFSKTAFQVLHIFFFVFQNYLCWRTSPKTFTFQNLINFVGPAVRRHNMYVDIPVTDKLLITLWCLANREAFRVLSRRFGLNRGTSIIS
jgi:hypothetical protein